MKRKLFFIAVIVICLSLTAYGTLAYFTAEDTAHNVITTGNVDITLIDEIEGGKKTDNGWAITGVMPSQEVKKIVSVKNTGKGDAWVRLKLTLTIKDADGFDLFPYIEDGINTFDVVTWDLGTNWVEDKDGYIYYKVPVKSGQTTESLFKNDIVQFAKEMDNHYQGSTVTIHVEAEAVQSANNGETYKDATGWPTSSTGEEE